MHKWQMEWLVWFWTLFIFICYNLNTELHLSRYMLFILCCIKEIEKIFRWKNTFYFNWTLYLELFILPETFYLSISRNSIYCTPTVSLAWPNCEEKKSLWQKTWQSVISWIYLQGKIYFYITKWKDLMLGKMTY